MGATRTRTSPDPTGGAAGRAAHRTLLTGTSWSMWHDGLLRSTGFAVGGLDRLVPAGIAAAADALADGTGTEEHYRALFASAEARTGAILVAIAGDDRFREAVTWQNPGGLTLCNSIQAAPPQRRNSRHRYREYQLTRMWQRYCAKTETIGFFGPLAALAVDPDGTTRCVPGPALLSRRAVFLEPWVVCTYAATLAADPLIRRWLPLTPDPSHALTGSSILRPGQPLTELTDLERRIVRAADGRTPARRVVKAIAGADGGLRADEVWDTVAELVSRKLLRWDSNLPLGPTAEPILNGRLDAIGDAQLRGRAQAGLQRLNAARAEVAAAAGDPGRLATSLAHLDTEFTNLTGHEPRRREGQMYAGRGVCFEDTLRDVDLIVGASIVARIATPLSVILHVARWASATAAAEFERGLDELYDARGPGPVRLSDLWDRAVALIWGRKRPVLDEVERGLAQRWEELFAPGGTAASVKRLDLDSLKLAERVQRVFPAERPGWAMARIHNCDLQLAAQSAAALGRGDFVAVVGELHLAQNPLSAHAANWFRPDPQRLLRRAVDDMGTARIIPLLPQYWSKDPGRLVHFDAAPDDVLLGFARTSGTDPARVVPSVAVTVRREAGRLVGVAPDGTVTALVEYFGCLLSMAMANVLRTQGRLGHTPRVSIGQVVVFRESWTLTAADVDALVAGKDDAARFAAARRLRARLGMPERCFAKLSTESKPVYLDFRAPAYVSSWCAMLRSARKAGHDCEVRISEMLPLPEHAWLADAQDERYLSELRLQLTDARRAATVAGARGDD